MSEAINSNARQAPATSANAKWIKLGGLALLIVAFILAGLFLPIGEYIKRSLQWVQDLGPAGPLAVIVMYILACILFVPGTIFTLASGFLFGLGLGTATVWIGATIGMCVSFLIGRFLARDWVAGRVANNKRFKAIDDAVGREGFKIVLLTRLSPIFPFNMQNYAYALTGVKFWSYALASAIGILPGTIMFVYFGSTARSLTEVFAGEVEKSGAQRILFWVGLIATVAVATYVTRIARRALKEATDRQNIDLELEEK